MKFDCCNKVERARSAIQNIQQTLNQQGTPDDESKIEPGVVSDKLLEGLATIENLIACLGQNWSKKCRCKAELRDFIDQIFELANHPQVPPNTSMIVRNYFGDSDELELVHSRLENLARMVRA